MGRIGWNGMRGTFACRASNQDSSSIQRIEVALQKNGGGHFIDVLLAVFAADVGGDEDAVGLRGGEAFVPGLDRDRNLFGEGVNEIASLFGGRAVSAVHISGHPDEDQLDWFF